MNRNSRLSPRPFSPISGNMGLTLVELLVAMTVGAIVLAGGFRVYADQVQSSRRLQAYSHLQESGRVALDILEHDIRMAGFTGCFSTNTTINNTLNATFPSSFQPDRGIQGWEAKDTEDGKTIGNVSPTSALVKSNNGNWITSGGNSLEAVDVVANSDIIRIWGGGDSDIDIVSITSGANTVIEVPKTANIEEDAILMVSDCTNADIVQACGVADNGAKQKLTLSSGCSPGNDTSLKLKTDPGQDPSLTLLTGTIYLVSKHNSLTTNPPSLFRAQLNPNGAVIGAMEELVEGVESMQMLFGENINDDNLKSADAYVTADKVSDWTKVVSVRLSVLLQSIEDNLADGPAPYRFNGVNYNGESGNPSASDRRLRRVFTRTITLRNRTLGS
ncbi:PilW family protein [Teredinibacter waterburyi]|jgi:prepilin-type N-terminal cleavage/methylation domain|uniref:PilW family protein n=1 Tax=Teredinibacter waterburyi TaxID=1500538 RepID=UPI00165F4804|nr:PilW family protein [Teredinibacter waterburyi]